MSEPCECCAFANDRMTLQDWTRVHSFLSDLTNPDMYAFSLRDPDIVRRAGELLLLFDPPKELPCGSPSQS
jgi:hypothetical protein